MSPVSFVPLFCLQVAQEKVADSAETVKDAGRKAAGAVASGVHKADVVAGQVAHAVAGSVSGAAHSARDAASRAGHVVQQGTHQAGHAVSSAAHQAGSAAKHSASAAAGAAAGTAASGLDVTGDVLHAGADTLHAAAAAAHARADEVRPHGIYQHTSPGDQAAGAVPHASSPVGAASRPMDTLADAMQDALRPTDVLTVVPHSAGSLATSVYTPPSAPTAPSDTAGRASTQGGAEMHWSRGLSWWPLNKLWHKLPSAGTDAGQQLAVEDAQEHTKEAAAAAAGRLQGDLHAAGTAAARQAHELARAVKDQTAASSAQTDAAGRGGHGGKPVAAGADDVVKGAAGDVLKAGYATGSTAAGIAQQVAKTASKLPAGDVTSEMRHVAHLVRSAGADKAHHTAEEGQRAAGAAEEAAEDCAAGAQAAVAGMSGSVVEKAYETGLTAADKAREAARIVKAAAEDAAGQAIDAGADAAATVKQSVQHAGRLASNSTQVAVQDVRDTAGAAADKLAGQMKGAADKIASSAAAAKDKVQEEVPAVGDKAFEACQLAADGARQCVASPAAAATHRASSLQHKLAVQTNRSTAHMLEALQVAPRAAVLAARSIVGSVVNEIAATAGEIAALGHGAAREAPGHAAGAVGWAQDDEGKAAASAAKSAAGHWHRYTDAQRAKIGQAGQAVKAAAQGAVHHQQQRFAQTPAGHKLSAAWAGAQYEGPYASMQNKTELAALGVQGVPQTAGQALLDFCRHTSSGLSHAGWCWSSHWSWVIDLFEAWDCFRFPAC